MKKSALVLSGGGFKGAFQVGALKYLQENWHKLDPIHPKMKFDIIAGVSVGALNGLLVATDKFDELTSLWQKVAKNGVEEIYTSDFIDTKVDQTDPNPDLKLSLTWDSIKKQFPKTTRNVFLRALFRRKSLMNSLRGEIQNFKSIADNTPLKNKLKDYAKRDEVKDCIFKCGYVSLNDGKYYSLKHSDFKTDNDFLNAILASTAMPIIWSPVQDIHSNIADSPSKHSVDGGIRCVSPLADVIKEISVQDSSEEYTIVIINCSSGKIPNEDFQDKNIAQIALRSLVDIAITEVFNNDVKEFIDKNYILEQVISKYPNEMIYDYDYKNKMQGHPLKYFKAIIIQPDENYLGDNLTANEALINRRIEHGYYKAKLALDEHLGNAKEMKFTIA
ncbi:MAG: patatin-like phospholipase family protein [Cyclobacteriaceae bacterium]